ncbi:hypothetical protein D1007_27590 [Hordeum vulgare]|nr:hypothetical protein D1007_27590 [Hordeum vulgare]
MDPLTAEQVEWQPYGAEPSFGDAHMFQLNPICLQEKHLWLMCCPLMCNWAVEFHLPHRVMHQFGLFQPHTPEWVDTDTQLHRLIREGCQTSLAPVLNFVCKEIKKQADATEATVDKTPGGKEGESALRLFMKVEDEMTLKAFRRSAYMLKPRKEFKRYSPDDYANKGKNPVAGGSRLSRMRGMDDEDDNDDDDDDELDEPEPVIQQLTTEQVPNREELHATPWDISLVGNMHLEEMATFIPVKFTEFCQPDATMPFGKELIQITKDLRIALPTITGKPTLSYPEDSRYWIEVHVPGRTFEPRTEPVDFKFIAPNWILGRNMAVHCALGRIKEVYRGCPISPDLFTVSRRGEDGEIISSKTKDALLSYAQTLEKHSGTLEHRVIKDARKIKQLLLRELELEEAAREAHYEHKLEGEWREEPHERERDLTSVVTAMDAYLLVTKGWLAEMEAPVTGSGGSKCCQPRSAPRTLPPSDLPPLKGVEREGKERETAMGWGGGAMGGRSQVAGGGRGERNELGIS